MNDTEKIIKIVFFILIGVFIGWGMWHPFNNNYVSKVDYDALDIKYNQLVQEHEQLKMYMAELISEFYAKSFIFDIIGLRKHQRAFCAVQKYIIGEIPILGELIC